MFNKQYHLPISTQKSEEQEKLRCNIFTACFDEGLEAGYLEIQDYQRDVVKFWQNEL